MSKYLRLFNNHAEYLAFTQTSDFLLPNVSHCISENDVHYNPIPHDYSKDYLTFVARENGATFTFNGTTVDEVTNKASYSLDDGNTWTEIESGVSTPSVNRGKKILWKGEMTPSTSYPTCIGTFTATAKFDVEGNIMSLLYGDNFDGQTNLEGKDYAFSHLFERNTNVVSAENLSQPATTLASSCYYRMFYGCTSLTTAPELPATILAERCYEDMFKDCTSLVTPPKLPATTLGASCYYYMFDGCTSLITAPELPATILAERCYQYMFNGCTSLTTAPELPATTLASRCYTYMFYRCTSLTTVPTVLPATTLAERCYQFMFQDCTSLTTAPELPATTLTNYCYYQMFRDCTSLNYIKAMFTTTPSTNYTGNWVSGVAATGTFVKNSAATWDVSGVNGVPSGWTIETATV